MLPFRLVRTLVTPTVTSSWQPTNVSKHSISSTLFFRQICSLGSNVVLSPVCVLMRTTQRSKQSNALQPANLQHCATAGAMLGCCKTKQLAFAKCTTARVNLHLASIPMHAFLTSMARWPSLLSTQAILLYWHRQGRPAGLAPVSQLWVSQKQPGQDCCKIDCAHHSHAACHTQL